MKSILFLAPYPLREAPSQRFRFEQYFDVLENAGFHLEVRSFFNQKGWQQLYETGKPVQKVWQVILGFTKRLGLLFRMHSHDFIFIHREASPLGPPVLEWIIVKVLKKKIIYDFDDAIWLEDPTEQGTLLLKLKWKSKIGAICKWSWKISAGNEFLADYARQFNKNVIINPTTIDTKHRHNPALYEGKKSELPVIGWTGTHSTMLYLNTLLPVLLELEKRLAFKFLVISNRAPDLQLKSLEYRPWNKATEIEDLMAIDMGLMPLTDDPWSRGKCGFKALQYMALEIPALVSLVGVNSQIIDHGVNGFLCKTNTDWYSYLEQLINQPSLRKEMGKKGRQEVILNYSVTSNASNFLSLFE